jgi:hypothetical protein
MANPQRQSTADVLLIRPKGFGPNVQTAGSNAFQQPPASGDDAIQAGALREFNDLVAALDRAGVRTHVFDDTAAPRKPDAVFPNNWVTFHDDGTVVLYPLAAANRRPERRRDVIEALGAQHGFRIERVLDLSPLEARNEFLEGTGSVVLDRPNRIAYAALSSRTTAEALRAFASHLNYEVVAFATADASGRPVYHTNVVMSIGERFAVICTEVFSDRQQRRRALESLQQGGRRVIPISFAQMEAFAGNILQLNTAAGQPVIAMRSRRNNSGCWLVSPSWLRYRCRPSSRWVAAARAACWPRCSCQEPCARVPA